MLANNPFVSITSSGNEKVVDRVREKVELQMYINSALNGGALIVLKGSPGVGKSTLVHLVLKDLGKVKNLEVIKEEFTPSTYNQLRSININPLKKLLIVLDDFNNIEMLDAPGQTKILNLLDDLAQRVGILLVENRDEGVEKDFKRLGKRFEKFEIKGLSRADLKQLVVNRLNMVRSVPTEQIDPFNEEEYEKIYKKSTGNPRIALLICSALYDQKETTVI